jgi:hypothetical protein
MRLCILVICLYTLLGCRCRDTNAQTNLTDTSKFVLFLNNFDKLNLPLSIMKLDDFGKYSDTLWQVINGSTQLVPNPVCKVIEKSNYNFIKVKYPTDKNYHYAGLYKTSVNDYFLLIMKQSNYLTNEYWLKLSLYNKIGNLLDTLTIAGQKVNDYDRYCKINTNLTINIRMIKELTSEEGDNDLLPALEIKEEYIITKDGHLKCLSHSKENGYFKFENNEIIRVK